MEHQAPGTPIELSIVICTYNRAACLKETLDSFSSVHGTSASNIELLVVDNNSTDGTRLVVERFAKEHPFTRYAFTRTQGLSHARNTGIQQSRGKFVAYVDDDVLFDEYWLTAVLETFTKYRDAACIGGKSIPKFESGQPIWAKNEVLRIYGSTQSGDLPKWMIYPEHPFGLNMIFRREVFDQVGEFDTRLGRKDKNLLSMEESDYFLRVAQANLKVIYEPTAILYHRIPTSRTTLQWALNRFYWQGISSVVFRQIHAPLAKTELLKALWVTTKALSRQITGGNISPRRIYWHYSKFPPESKIYLATSLGRFRALITQISSL